MKSLYLQDLQGGKPKNFQYTNLSELKEEFDKREIKIGANFKFGKSSLIFNKTIIGSNVEIGDDVLIGNCKKVVIGSPFHILEGKGLVTLIDNVEIGNNVKIKNSVDIWSDTLILDDVTIENNTVIKHNVLIKSGITIKKRSIIEEDKTIFNNKLEYKIKKYLTEDQIKNSIKEYNLSRKEGLK